ALRDENVWQNSNAVCQLLVKVYGSVTTCYGSVTEADLTARNGLDIPSVTWPMLEPMLRRGVYPALITFYDERERVDSEASAAHRGRLIDAGVDGVVVGGSTGEFHLLSLDERRALLEAVAGAAGGRVAVTAHVGAPTTRATCELAQHAAEHGADAVLVVT